MAKLRVNSYSISIDGFGAGPGQSLKDPQGVGGMGLHKWVFGTRTFQKLFGGGDGSTGLDDRYAARGFENIGSWILGRNMFSPSRGPWPNDDWKGWWGDNPPYHCDVFVLTHHARPSLTMEGGTTFHFETGGPEAALKKAFQAAGGKDVRLGGGAATIRSYLKAGLVDEMHIAISPVLLGSGESLLAGLDLPALGYEVSEHAASELATHCVFTRKCPAPQA